jgi:hypothetical protein
MSKISVDQAALTKSLKRVAIGVASGKSGNEQATKLLFKGLVNQVSLELIASDGQISVRSRVPLLEALKTDVNFGVEAAAFGDLVSHLDSGPLYFDFDDGQEYLRYQGITTKVNLATVKIDSFRTFDQEEQKAVTVGRFKTKDMAVGLDYARLFLDWSDDKDSKDSDSQILWVRNSEFVAGPGKVLGVFKCENIPVEFKMHLTAVQAMLKYLKELTSEECEISKFADVFYIIKPGTEVGEAIVLPQSPRNPPMENTPGDVLEYFKATDSFRVDRESLQRAIQRVKVVLSDSKVLSFKLQGVATQAKLLVEAEDLKSEKSSAIVDVVRDGSINTEVVFKLNYSLLLSLMKLNSSSVLKVGLVTDNFALNIVEQQEGYSFNAMLGFVMA